MVKSIAQHLDQRPNSEYTRLNSTPTPVETGQWQRTNRNQRILLDLTVSRLNELLGLEAEGVTYLWISVEHADGVFEFRLKQTNGELSDSFIGVSGALVEQHEFVDVSVSNSVMSGLAVLQVGWRVE